MLASMAPIDLTLGPHGYAVSQGIRGGLISHDMEGAEWDRLA